MIPPLTHRKRCLLNLLCSGIMLMASGCVLPPVKQRTQDTIQRRVHAGMRVSDARAELESMNYLCRRRQGSYFDLTGREQQVSGSFLVCTHQPGAISFQCNYRTQVIVIAQRDRVTEVQVAEAPSCIKQ